MAENWFFYGRFSVQGVGVLAVQAAGECGGQLAEVRQIRRGHAGVAGGFVPVAQAHGIHCMAQLPELEAGFQIQRAAFQGQAAQRFGGQLFGVGRVGGQVAPGQPVQAHRAADFWPQQRQQGLLGQPGVFSVYTVSGWCAGPGVVQQQPTHTVQQGAAPQAPPQARRSLLPAISEHSAPAVQRLGIGDALDYFAEHANFLPGFRMFTLVLGVNPINMRPVDRSAGNLLRAVVELMPGGALITQALDNHGIIDRVAGWVQQQLASLGMVGGSIRQQVGGEPADVIKLMSQAAAGK